MQERACVFPFPPLYSFNHGGTTQLYNLVSLHRVKQYGTKVPTIPCIHEWAFWIDSNHYLAQGPNLLTISHQIPKAQQNCSKYQSVVYIPVFRWRPVKVEHPPRTPSCTQTQLHNGLGLELAVWCERVLPEALADTWLPSGYPAGGAYESYSYLTS